jgi:hypothetical protein
LQVLFVVHLVSASIGGPLEEVFQLEMHLDLAVQPQGLLPDIVFDALPEPRGEEAPGGRVPCGTRLKALGRQYKQAPLDLSEEGAH